jgi:hypothetical protein
MDEQKIHAYGEAPGKHARMAVELAKAGESARFEKHVAWAAQDGDLFHPDYWGAWVRICESKPERFALAASKLTAGEAKKLTHARCHHGWAAIVTLSAAPGVLEALGAVGVDWSKASSLIGNASVRPEVVMAFQVRLDGLARMMDAGWKVENPLPAEVSAAVSKQTPPRTLLHVLAASALESYLSGFKDSAKRLPEIAAWLGSGASLSARDSKGRDALKIAIDEGNPSLALALLEIGSNPLDKDSKGRDAMAVLNRRCAAYERECDWGKKSGLELVRAALLAHAERRELDSSAGWSAQIEAAPAKRRSL